MALKFEKKPGTLLFLLYFIITITSCDQKREASTSTISQEVCECFGKQKTGDIDTRLTPCINSVPHFQTATLQKGYSQHDSTAAMHAMLSKEANNMSEIMNNLVTSCDAVGSEVEIMYDKWYPVDSSVSNLSTIKILSDKFQIISPTDTTAKKILHELIARNIKARHLQEALQRYQQMKQLYKCEGGAYFASAFVYSLQKKYPLSINELEQEISINNDTNLKLLIAVIKRKAQRDKITIN